jgi:uncharacterized repeat protein (TIGR01451 family)
MKLLFTLLFITTFSSFAQLTGTISGTTSVCQGGGTSNVTFTGLYGTAPYTFYYSVNGGVTQSISTISGNSVQISHTLASAGVFYYTLSSVQDATMANQIVSGTATLTINASPTVNAGADQSICLGSSATLSGSGAMTYSWTNGITNAVAFSPVTTLTYTVTGTSSSGCLNTDQVVVTVNPLPLINAGPDLEMCIGNTAIMNGSGSAVTYTWSPSSGLSSSTTSSPTVSPTITTTYTLFGVSALGCMNSDQVTVFSGTPPVIPSITVDSAYCNNGTITLGQNASTANYLYSWSNGSTLPYLTNLPAGPYILDVYNDGCVEQLTVDVPLSANPGNCAEITGFVYFDLDDNCAVNGLDSPIANRLLVANPGNHLAVSDNDGFYTLQVPVGTYTVEEIINNPFYGNNCVSSYSVPIMNITDSIGGNNFLDTIQGNVDIQASIYNTGVLPGFSCNVQINYNSVNLGGTLMNQYAWFTFPPFLVMQNWSYPHTISNDTVYFTLNSSQSFSSWINFITNVGVTLGTQATFCTGVGILPGEQNITNNIDCSSTMVIGSFDPNDKTSFVNGVQNDSTLLLSEQQLEYVIRFQNTGTAPAQNIYILDTIQSTLELSSFEFVASSHPCSVSILEGNVLKFNFPSIMLPDSTNNEPESHGFVHYKINQSAQNEIGDILLNTAYIYFDFNAPVVTNTTYDELIEDDLGLTQSQYDLVKLYPNPSESFVNIESEQNIQSFEIIDLNGRMITSNQKVDSKKLNLDFSAYQKGIYLVQLTIGNQQIVKRISIQ